MAVDTLTKRSGALRFGHGARASTRPPSATFDAFERGVLLGCYYQVPVVTVIGDPVIGWTYSNPENIWTYQYSPQIFMVEMN